MAQSFIEHLTELRQRLLIITGSMLVMFVVFYVFKVEVLNFLLHPLKQNLGQAPLIFTSVPELFFVYLKTTFFAAFFVTFPIFLWQVWRFVAPGLYQAERKIVLPAVFATLFLFYLGGVFTWGVIMPLATQFFLSFQTDAIQALPAVQAYLSFFLKMMFAFGLAFELPVLLVLLMFFGVVSREKLASLRPYMVVGFFALAAVLTPPDPISQLLLALPMFLLYEAALLVGRTLPQKNKGPSLPANS